MEIIHISFDRSLIYRIHRKLEELCFSRVYATNDTRNFLSTFLEYLNSITIYWHI